jgi:transcriptional regulator with XRE-family HTH domain
MWGFQPTEWKSGREAAGLTQERAAKQLGVSQAYLALLEGGRRPLTDRLGFKMVELYGLGAAALPLDAADVESWDSSRIARSLANLGYSGFGHLRGGPLRNPAVVLLAALSRDDLEVRLLEALPWVAVEYHHANWEWLIREAKQRDIQNRLGFVVTLGRQVAERRGSEAARTSLRQVEGVLERARLVRQDTLCQASLSGAERRWLRERRSADARHWNLLTDLDSAHLPYAA